MGGDVDARFTRLVNNRGELLVGEDAFARIGVWKPGAFGGHDLYYIDSTFDLRADDSAELLCPGHRLAHQIAKLRKVNEQLVGGTRAHVITGGDDVRQISHARMIQFPDAYVEKVVDAQIPHRRRA